MRAVISGYRYYSSELGRWTNRDPIGDVGSIKLFWNMEFVDFDEEPLYTYVLNSPINQIDPHGLSSFWDSHRHFYPENYSDDSPLEKQRIRERIRKEQIKKKFLEWYEANKDISWTASLPKCPDKLCLIKGQKVKTLKRDGWSKFEAPSSKDVHPGSKWCIRSVETEGHYGQQCCYKSNGELIKDKYSFSSGTPDFRHWSNIPGISGEHGTHFEEDYVPFNWARILDGKDTFGKYNRMYNDVRPPDQGGGAKLKKDDCCANGPE